jgi:hypothetical protein
MRKNAVFHRRLLSSKPKETSFRQAPRFHKIFKQTSPLHKLIVTLPLWLSSGGQLLSESRATLKENELPGFPSSFLLFLSNYPILILSSLFVAEIPLAMTLSVPKDRPEMPQKVCLLLCLECGFHLHSHEARKRRAQAECGMKGIRLKPDSNPFRLSLILLAILALVFPSGCATTPSKPSQPGSFDYAPTDYMRAAPPVPSMAVRQKLGSVAIVPAQYAPSSNFYNFAKGPLASAAAGAGGSVLAGGTAGGITAVITPAAAAYAAPVLIVMLTISTAVVAVIEGIHGAKEAAAVPAEKTQLQMKSAIDEAVSRLDSQDALARRLTADAQKDDRVRLQSVEAAGPSAPDKRPGYEQLSKEGVDTILEVGINEIGFDGCGKGFTQAKCPGGSDKPQVFLFMIARARLVRVADSAELYVNEFRYDSPPRTLAEWVAADASAFAEELEHGYGDLADRMNDEVLWVTPIALPVPSDWLMPGAPLFRVCWLYPLYPGPTLKGFPEIMKEAWAVSELFGPIYGISPLSFSVLDSTSPALRWSSFPRDIDREKLDPKVLAKIGDVTYDLRIWEAVGSVRGKLAYERTSLPEPEHQLEGPLKPDQRYFWTFRARFRYDGQPMVTRWASLRGGSCDRDLIPSYNYYRFATPK